jgi:hypothetical protein
VAAAGVRGVPVGRRGELPTEDDRVAFGRHETTDDSFARPVVVDVGGVEEGAARLAEGGVDLLAGRFLGPESPFGADRHGAQAQFADAQAGPAEQVRPHGVRHRLDHPVGEPAQGIHRLVRIADAAAEGAAQSHDALDARAGQPVAPLGLAVRRVHAHGPGGHGGVGGGVEQRVDGHDVDRLVRGMEIDRFG